MKEELATRYNPADFEKRIYGFWEEGGFFTRSSTGAAEVLDRHPAAERDRAPAHWHALVNTLQDILVRWNG